MQPSQLRSLTTESRNPNTMGISQAEPLEMLQMINEEDMKVAQAVNLVLPHVKIASDFAYESISNQRPTRLFRRRNKRQNWRNGCCRMSPNL